MNRKEAEKLFKKYRRGQCTPEEVALLETWYIRHAKEMERLRPDEKRMDKDLKDIWNALPVHQKHISLSWYYVRMVGAAVVLIALTVIMISKQKLYIPANEEETAVARAPLKADTVGKEAYILLDNGQTIALNSRVSGTIYKNEETSINKTGGKIAYDTSVERSYLRAASRPAFNTIVIPKGKQYELLLADGTHVWLNSLSSIRFPTRFGEERKVEITGEAYFEVAKDSERPFIVKAHQQTVKVLGTHFNVQAYENERFIKTTLLEGSVQVSVPDQTDEDRTIVRFLRPGQQARSSAGKGQLNVVAVDAQEAIAWKSGLILFKDANIESIMRQICRWHDIEVVYDGEPSERRFTGGVSKNAPLSEFLKVLEINEIHFEKEGQKLIIYNN